MVLGSVISRFTEVFASILGRVVGLHDVTDSRGTGIRGTGTSIELYDRRCDHLDTTTVLSCLPFVRDAGINSSYNTMTIG